MMGIDWRRLTWSEYQMTLAGWNAAHSPAEKGWAELSSDRAERLARFERAHSVH